MKCLGIRFCSTTPEAEALSRFLGPEGLGLAPLDWSTVEGVDVDLESFPGSIFPVGSADPIQAGSWIEVWKDGPEMPAGLMLQIVVDDADAWARQARSNGLEPQGPMDAHGERIYFLRAPGGLSVSFQSTVPGEAAEG